MGRVIELLNMINALDSRLGRYSEVLSVMKPSKMAVNAVAMYQSSEGWLIFVGRKDGAIAVFMSGHSDPIRLLHQHDSNGEHIVGEN